MATTYLHAVASLDGYVADERDDVGPLHDWYFDGDHPSSTRTTPMFTVRRASTGAGRRGGSWCGRG